MAVRSIVIKGINWVGDTILTTPAIGALHRGFPEARITVVARPWVAPLLEANDDISDIWEVDERNRLKFLAVAARMRRYRFDLGILFPNSFASALLLALGGVSKRVGYDRDGRAILLTDRVAVTEDVLKVHQVEYYMNIVGKVCDITNSPRRLVLNVRPSEHEWVRAFLQGQGVEETELVVGVNPGAHYGSAKRWFPKRFGAVARYCAQRYGAKVVIIGSKNEVDIAGEVASMAEVSVLNFSGQLTLRQLAALIARCSLYITNDSGSMHIAAALNVPLVAIFGSTDWVTTAPYSEKAIVVRKPTECAPCLLRECPTDHRCMEAITVDDVIQAVDKHLHGFAPAHAKADAKWSFGQKLDYHF
jgi:heptosyltransferase-2